MSDGFGSDRLPCRFWAKVHVTATGCWEWTGSLNESGYGKIWDLGERRSVRAHRMAFEAFHYPLDGALLDHTCHGEDQDCTGGLTCVHRRCVNPWHLEPVTNRTNLLRGRTFAARRVAQTHCKRGHPFDEENTGRDNRGNRLCRTCHRAKCRAAYARRRAVALTRKGEAS